ncbi:MAG: hypothetical protein JO100_01415 [Pseudonocardia sp.]|nr:hypothetical protein [Pseudonocardia sp.]
MDTYLETRGREIGQAHKFLGTQPADTWWSQGYGELTKFTNPTILVERDDNGWRLYIGAIPSSRHDPYGAVNRVNIVAESPGRGDDATDAIVRLVDAYLRDIAENREPGEARHALDEAFPEEVVGRLYTDSASTEEVRGRLLIACGSLSPAVSAEDRGDSWIAPVRGEKGRAAFVARVRALVQGELNGAAIFVNVVDDPAAFALRHDDSDLAVLVVDPEEHLSEEPQSLIKKDNRPITTPSPPTPRTSHQPRAQLLIRVLAAALLTLAAVIGLVWWLLSLKGVEAASAPERTSISSPLKPRGGPSLNTSLKTRMDQTGSFSMGWRPGNRRIILIAVSPEC